MKAVLVIDRQKDCIGCPLCMQSNYDTDRCFITKIAIEDLLEDKEIFKAYCPLKLLPQKHKEVVRTTYDGTITNQVELQFTAGYNACIDELLGE